MINTLEIARYWMDNLMCDGKEDKLADCRNDGWGNHDCTDAETAGVICGKENPDAVPTVLKTTPAPELPKKMIQVNLEQ